ncbi:hypothetical protein J2Z26_000328 [Bacillus luteolus]|nr:hypothetical protein [Cytobacillus luteolus]
MNKSVWNPSSRRFFMIIIRRSNGNKLKYLTKTTKYLLIEQKYFPILEVYFPIPTEYLPIPIKYFLFPLFHSKYLSLKQLIAVSPNWSSRL